MPNITFAGQTFELKAEPPKAGRLMLLARAEKKGGVDAMAGMLDFLESMLHPSADLELFEQAIADVDEDELASALKEAAESYDVDPTSARPTSSSSSPAGPSQGERTSRVVSFSQDKRNVS